MGIYFLLLSEILIILSVVYVLVSDVREVLKKCKESPLFQIGQTCGFYALSQAVYECRRRCRDANGSENIEALKQEEESLAKQAQKMIRESIEAGESCIGEIFDIAYIPLLAERYFDDIRAEIKPYRDMKDVDRELDSGAVVIFPCVHKGLPHYLLVDGGASNGAQELVVVSGDEVRKAEQGEYYKVSNRYHNFRFASWASREELAAWHNRLYAGEYSFFSWVDYFKPRVRGMLNSLLNSFVQRKVATELHKYLLEAERKKKKQINNNHTKLKMVGLMVSVSCRERRL